MTEIDITHYRKGDVLQIPGYNDTVLDSTLSASESYTGLVDEVPVFCCGLSLYWAGHAECWLIIRPPESKYIGIFKKVSGLLDWSVAKNNIHRLSAHCRADWSGANAVAKHLGFKLEAPLINYGPKRETYNLYGRVWQQ